MTNSFDNSAIESYLNEYSKREAEKTRSLNIKNSRKEIPVKLAKILGLAVLVTCIGLAIKLGLSFHSQHTIKNISDGVSFIQEEKKDKTINIEKILNDSEKSKKFNDFVNSENKNNKILRNYYIFDHIKVDYGAIEEVVIGRHFDNENSEPLSTYCYVDSFTEGFKKTFYLINIDEKGREEAEITKKMIEASNFSREDLLNAQSRCGI